MEQGPQPQEEERFFPPQDLLYRICEAIREELQIGTLMGPDCCIPATAIVIDVLDHFRLDARPLSVTVSVFNPTMTERIDREGMPTPEDAERDWFQSGCHSIGIGLGDDDQPGRWAGHLVANLADRVLIDLTLPQANRPAHGIDLPEVILAPIEEGFLQARHALAATLNGCLVIYQARPGDRSFERSPDWRSKKRRDSIVGAAIRRLKRG
jgi:hypothetical protein